MNEKRHESYPLHDYYSRIYRKYDLVNRLFTLSNDMKWRKITVRRCLKLQPISVIDLCCGTGDITLFLRKWAPQHVTIIGFDFNEKMLSRAKEKAAKKQLQDIEFIHGDVVSMPFKDGTFDSMTIGFGFRNLTFENACMELHMKEMSRILKKGGHVLVLESSVPRYTFIRFFYNIYLKFFMVPLGAIVTGDTKMFKYLARSSANFFTVPELAKLWNTYGFSIESVRTFFLGSANLIILRKE